MRACARTRTRTGHTPSHSSSSSSSSASSVFVPLHALLHHPTPLSAIGLSLPFVSEACKERGKGGDTQSECPSRTVGPRGRTVEPLQLSLVSSALFPKKLEAGEWDSEFTLSDHGRVRHIDRGRGIGGQGGRGTESLGARGIGGQKDRETEGKGGRGAEGQRDRGAGDVCACEQAGWYACTCASRTHTRAHVHTNTCRQTRMHTRRDATMYYVLYTIHYTLYTIYYNFVLNVYYIRYTMHAYAQRRTH